MEKYAHDLANAAALCSQEVARDTSELRTQSPTEASASRETPFGTFESIAAIALEPQKTSKIGMTMVL